MKIIPFTAVPPPRMQAACDAVSAQNALVPGVDGIVRRIAGTSNTVIVSFHGTVTSPPVEYSDGPPRSSSNTEAPDSAMRSAATIPAAPAPATM